MIIIVKLYVEDFKKIFGEIVNVEQMCIILQLFNYKTK